jgi:hypothetical protein
LDFIINYDIKYRMGLGGEETEEKENSLLSMSEGGANQSE